MSVRSTATCMLALALVVGASVADDRSAAQRPLVPADDLPIPLERVAPLGVEGFEAAWTASDEQVELGRKLFFDARLSKDATIACASCHRPEFAFADDRRFSLGIEGQATVRNSPSVLNKALSTNVMWDGRAATLEAQALLPIENEAEMGLGVPAALEFLNGDAEYLAEFKAVFGGPADKDRLGQAIAAFIRALTAGDSPVDRFRDGDFAALTGDERSGLWIFDGRGGCWRCHEGPNFSDESFHNTGIGAVDGVPEVGRYVATSDERDRGAFRTPGLRMLTKTAPYMHDGSLETLEQVIEFYRDGGHPNAQLADEIVPLELSDEDVANLVAFLRALSR